MFNIQKLYNIKMNFKIKTREVKLRGRRIANMKSGTLFIKYNYFGTCRRNKHKLIEFWKVKLPISII